MKDKERRKRSRNIEKVMVVGGIEERIEGKEKSDKGGKKKLERRKSNRKE